MTRRATRAPWRRLLRAGVLLLAGCAAAAQADVSLELRVKAAFLFNFAKFTSWPEDKLGAADAAILFCVPDGDALAPALEEALAGKTIDAHPLRLRRVTQPEGFRDCHVAYLGAPDAERLQAALARIAGAGVLTVYEADGTQHEGLVRLYVEERKVHFEINEAAARRERLQLSSRLLGVASVVRE